MMQVSSRLPEGPFGKIAVENFKKYADFTVIFCKICVVKIGKIKAPRCKDREARADLAVRADDERTILLLPPFCCYFNLDGGPEREPRREDRRTHRERLPEHFGENIVEPRVIRRVHEIDHNSHDFIGSEIGFVKERPQVVERLSELGFESAGNKFASVETHLSRKIHGGVFFSPPTQRKFHVMSPPG